MLIWHIFQKTFCFGNFFVGYLSASPIGYVGIKDPIVRRPKPLFPVFTFSEGEAEPPGPSETHIVQDLGDLIKQPIVTGDTRRMVP